MARQVPGGVARQVQYQVERELVLPALERELVLPGPERELVLLVILTSYRLRIETTPTESKR